MKKITLVGIGLFISISVHAKFSPGRMEILGEEVFNRTNQELNCSVEGAQRLKKMKGDQRSLILELNQELIDGLGQNAPQVDIVRLDSQLDTALGCNK